MISILCSPGPSLQGEEEEEEEYRREFLYLHVCLDPDSTDGWSQASSYGSSHLLPSYWFIIKNSQAPHLHVFFSSWLREAYLDQDTPPVSDLQQDLFTRTDFLVDETDRSLLWQEEREGEEEEEEVEEEEYVPILTVDQRREMALHFPARCITDSWDLGENTDIRYLRSQC